MAKFFLALLVILALAITVFPAQAQAPEGYNFPWQTTGPTQAQLIYQIHMVAGALGYPTTWPPDSLDNGAQSLIWLNIGTDNPEYALHRVLCGLSWVYPKWRSSRVACEALR